MEDVKIYAHRCAPLDGKPENSLEAARQAIENGADGFEIDVRITCDGEPVAIHDVDLSRISGGRLKSKISELRYKDILRLGYDADIKISHLDYFIKMASEREKTIFIEVKSSDQRLLGRVAKTIENIKVNAVVISFKESDLLAVKNINPAIKTGLIVGSLSQVINFKNLFKFKKLMIYDYIFFGWDQEEPKTKWMFKCAVWYLYIRGLLPISKPLEYMLFAGITQNKSDLEYLRKWGFTNIFTDTIKALK